MGVTTRSWLVDNVEARGKPLLFLWLSKSSRGFGDLALQKSLGVLKNRKILENLDGNTVRIQEIGDSFLSKSTSEVFGFVDGDESWEVLNNTSDRVLFKSDDFSGTDWLNDFEARYPDTKPPYTDSEHIPLTASHLIVW